MISFWCDRITTLKLLVSSSRTLRVPSSAITQISITSRLTPQLLIYWFIATSEISLLKSELQILRLPCLLALSVNFLVLKSD